MVSYFGAGGEGDSLILTLRPHLCQRIALEDLLAFPYLAQLL